MLHLALTSLIVGLSAAVAVAARPAQAETWKVCNELAEDVAMSIVYDVLDQRRFVGKDWRRIGDRGRCAVVLSSEISIGRLP